MTERQFVPELNNEPAAPVQESTNPHEMKNISKNQIAKVAERRSKTFAEGGYKRASIGEIIDEIKGLGEVHIEELYYKDNTERLHPLTKYHALVSDKFRGQPVAVSTKSYCLVQHHEAMIPLMEAIEQQGINQMHYKLAEYPGKTYLNLLTDRTIVPSDDRIINIGFTVINSFDSTNALKIDSYAYRVECANGAVSSKIMGSKSIKHVGMRDRVMNEVQDMITKLDYNGENLLKYIENARQIKVENVEVAKKLLEAEELGKDFVNDAVVDFVTYEEFSMWGLVNAVTRVASANKSFQRHYQLSKKAENLLVDAYKQPAAARAVA